MNRYQAPRRGVDQVVRIGGYGHTWWLHSLSCGHIERRKRKAPTSEIGCTACGVEAPPPAQAVPLIDLIHIRLWASSALGVSFDDVDAYEFFDGIKIEAHLRDGHELA